MKRLPGLLALLGLLSAPSLSTAQTFGPGGAYFIEPYVTAGLSNPTTMAFLNDTTVLIFEKGTGAVKRAVNGTVVNTAIDLPVNSSSERGGLGICISPNFKSDNFVYLYYSHATSQGGTWTGNRVERFVYNDATGLLTFDSLIWNFAQDPTQANGANHDGGIIMIGPDDKLYIITGDLNRGGLGSPRIEQNTSTTAVAKVGGIHRLNLDGSIPSDNPFFAHASDDIKSLWAYGVRNSFGMTWDPLTNYIWFTENGPAVYDEVNVVPSAGMNSGWLKIMGPDGRNAAYSNNGNQNWNANQLTYINGTAYYRDPEFSWLSPIAVTSILIMATDKVRDDERNHVLMADNNFGNMYVFEMNGTRDGFVLGGTVADKVADSAGERNLNVFGSGWGVTTDLKIGPDGYIYAVSLFGNRVVRIRPTFERITAESLNIVRGVVESGGLMQTQSSDDDRLVIKPGIVLSPSQAPIALELTTTSPFLIPTLIQFTVESNASSSSVQQIIEMQLDDLSYAVLDQSNLTTTDGEVKVTIASNTADYVRPDGTMRARISYKLTAPALTVPWRARIDHAFWGVQQ